MGNASASPPVRILCGSPPHPVNTIQHLRAVAFAIADRNRTRSEPDRAAEGRGVRRRSLRQRKPHAAEAAHTGKEVWVAVHTKKDAGRLGNRILREAAGVE
jgi:hypothetical protein